MAAIQQILAALKAGTSAPSWRYWRVYVTATVGAGAQLRLAEVELRATAGGADVTTPSTPVTASSSASGQGPANAIDNNTSTYWASATSTMPDWIRFDLGTQTAISEIALMTSGFTDCAPGGFVIQGSNDDTSYTNVNAYSGTSGWALGAFKTFATA